MPTNLKTDDMGDVIKDFSTADAPQFKGLPDKKEVDEATTYYRSDPKYQKSMKDQEAKHKERDARMKHGKRYKEFMNDAGKAKTRLRPGEVKKYNKTTGKWESNKD